MKTLACTLVLFFVVSLGLVLNANPDRVYHTLMFFFGLDVAAIGFTIMYRKSIELYWLRRQAKDCIQQVGTKTKRINIGRVVVLMLVATCPAFSQTTEELPLTVLPHRILLVDAELNGRTVRLVVDTGASHTMIDNDLLDITVGEINRVAAGMRQGSGRFRSVVVRAKSLQLGHNIILYPQVLVADLDSISKLLRTKVDGVLGADVLSRFDEVTINWRKKVIRLTY